MLVGWRNVLFAYALGVSKDLEGCLIDLDAKLFGTFAGTRWAYPLPAVDWIVYG